MFFRVIDTLLASLPDRSFGFMLLLCRVGAATLLLPGLGEAELPVTVKTGLMLMLALVLFPPLMDSFPPVPADAWTLASMAAAEIICGLWLAWLARLILLALPMAGQIIASVAGQANVLQPDPTLGPQTTALSRLLALAAPVVVLATGLYALPLSALAGSYRLVPPGQLLPAADTTMAVVQALGTAFALALRLAGPFVLASIVWHVALGLLARLVPQMQVFLAAQAGQILGGLLLLAVLSTTLLAVWQMAARQSWSALAGL